MSYLSRADIEEIAERVICQYKNHSFCNLSSRVREECGNLAA